MKTTISIPTKNGYTDGDYIYRPAIAEKAVTWFGRHLRFPEEPHAGEPFVPTDWQADYIRSLYGWRSRANEERRRYTRAWLEVARGNGKTALHSGLGIKGLQGDGRRTPSVVSAATDRNTAGIIFKYAARMVLFDKGLASKLRILESTKRILRKTGTGVYFVISADANRAHGYHPTLVLLDEVHTQPSRELYDVLSTSQVTVDDPLMAMSTTAGYDRESICWELHERALAVAQDPAIDPNLLVAIYAADDTDDIEDPVVQLKANPNLGVTVSQKFLSDRVAEAKRSPAEMNKVLRLHFNVWTSTETAWILDKDWMAGAAILPDLKGRTCYGGLDLGYADDMAAFALFFPPQKEGEPYRALVWYWLPEAAIAKRRHKVPYDLWVERGLIRVTQGEAVSFGQIREDIIALSHQYNILEIGYDEWQGRQIAQELEGYGLYMIALRQGYHDMSFPVEQLATLIANRQIQHDGNDVLRWNVANVIMEQDPYAHLRPVKKKSKEKIDGLTALLMAVRQARLQEGAFQGGISVA